MLGHAVQVITHQLGDAVPTIAQQKALSEFEQLFPDKLEKQAQTTRPLCDASVREHQDLVCMLAVVEWFQSTE